MKVRRINVSFLNFLSSLSVFFINLVICFHFIINEKMYDKPIMLSNAVFLSVIIVSKMFVVYVQDYLDNDVRISYYKKIFVAYSIYIVNIVICAEYVNPLFFVSLGCLIFLCIFDLYCLYKYSGDIESQ